MPSFEVAAYSRPHNLWHKDWMERTDSAYEWWYLDALSDDGVWSLVVIFLLGNPFSPYTRLCSLGKKPDPFEHNGVFVSLHKNAKLHHYGYTKYPKRAISASDSLPLKLHFGANSWIQSESGKFHVVLDQENANRRRIRARLTFRDTLGSSQAPIGTAPSSNSRCHHWHLAVTSSRIETQIELNAPAISREPERISFFGNAYHDHNWGKLPLHRDYRRWAWAHASFTGNAAAVMYVWESVDGSFRTFASIRTQDNITYESYGEDMSLDGLKEFATRRTATCEINGFKLTIAMRENLENVPFYTRSLVDATLTGPNGTLHGQGLGEILRPKGMESWVVSEAMRLRIYEPGL